MNRRSRLPIVIVLILSLLCVGVTRHLAMSARNEEGANAVAVRAEVGTARLSRMNSFALALLLGGLRGPLVMFLWPSAEQQKSEKNLEDFDTKIEWIRLLQAEFDTVHIFQIWNKAYNVSVQMANLSNKYRTILDALDYAHTVDAEKPNDINIIAAIAQVYFDKLGGSTEKDYYRARVGEETRAREEMVRIVAPADRAAEVTRAARSTGVPRAKLQFNSDPKAQTISVTLRKSLVEPLRPLIANIPGVRFEPRPRPATTSRDQSGMFHRSELDPMLDASGNILPELLEPKYPRPADRSASDEWNDGSELQYLKQFEPYPRGLAPFALAYNYYKRAEVLQSVFKQSHAQLSDAVIDSRPALALKNWAEAEWDSAMKTELEALDIPEPSERYAMELADSSLPLTATIPFAARLSDAIQSYDLSARLADAAIGEYQRHLKQYQTNITVYISHMDDLRAQRELVLGDSAYLRAMVGSPTERTTFSRQAIEHYQAAYFAYGTSAVLYSATDNVIHVIFPPGVDKAAIANRKVPQEQLAAALDRFRAMLQSDKVYEYREDATNYFSYIDRARARLHSLNATPTTVPVQ